MATIINGDSGNNTLTAPTLGSNPDFHLDAIISGLAGNDTLTGSNGEDDIMGGDGNDVLEGKGGEYDDVSGGVGNDTYIVNLGTNLEYIDNYAPDNATTTDTLKLGAGITEADLFITRWNYGFGSNGALVIKVKNTNDVIFLDGYFSSFSTQSKIDQIVFANGTTWNQTTLESKIAYTTIGTAMTDVLVGTAAGESISGLGGFDFIQGGGGNDTLLGGTGTFDELQGDAGNDTYIFNTGDGWDGINNYAPDTASTTDVLKFGAGITQSGVTISQGIDEDDGLKDSSLNIAINGSSTDKVELYGYFDGYQIDRIDFDDGSSLTRAQIDAIVGRPIAEGTAATDFLEAYAAYGTDVYGYGGNDYLTGAGFADKLDGGAGNDSLDGDAGVDTLIGGSGNDTYIMDSLNDVITETSTLVSEIDTVESTVSYTLGANLENLVLTGAAAINGTGNGLNNTLEGNDGANILNGGLGADTMVGSLGNDTYIIDNVNDDFSFMSDVGIDQINASVSLSLIEFFDIENLVLTGTAAINAEGGFNANMLTGNSAANLLDGLDAADTLIGGLGNDTYVVDNIGDVVNEASTLAAEIDVVQSSVSFTLGANLEKLILIDLENINGIGNSLANTLTGNEGNNLLNGGAGIDTLSGGAGEDTYIIDNAADMVNEQDGFGTDVIHTSVSYSLVGRFVEKMVLTGAATNATGNGLNNVLTGNALANTLNGGLEADTLYGGAGNDTYIVDNVGDVASESSTVVSEIDTVQASASFTLGANLEKLMLTGTAAINGMGNSLANTLMGNNAANLLNGGAGIDTLTGGLGNDTYVIDHLSDVIVESSTVVSEIDTVNTSVTFSLVGQFVEKMTLTGAAAINGTGNGMNNTLIGNSAANVLNGGLGVDVLTGGLGNDTYIVDHGADVVNEVNGQGTDLVSSSVGYSLVGRYVENLTLTGTAALLATGNGLSNILTGNSANNTLTGNLGTDTLMGGLGNDTYSFSRTHGLDTIIENDATTGNTDNVSFSAGIATDQLWFKHVGNNLEVSVIGTNDKVVVKDWYSGSANHVEQFKTATGKTLLDSNVENLVSAMASMTQPPLGQTNLTAQQHTQLDAVIAANWS